MGNFQEWLWGFFSPSFIYTFLTDKFKMSLVADDIAKLGSWSHNTHLFHLKKISRVLTKRG